MLTICVSAHSHRLALARFAFSMVDSGELIGGLDGHVDQIKSAVV